MGAFERDDPRTVDDARGKLRGIDPVRVVVWGAIALLAAAFWIFVAWWIVA